jgi:K+-sensing histidine kinase KdpD
MGEKAVSTPSTCRLFVLCLLATVVAVLVWRFVFDASNSVGLFAIAILVFGLLSFVDGIRKAW